LTRKILYFIAMAAGRLFQRLKQRLLLLLLLALGFPGPCP
jgi:hypothetical protein